jgi:hypothetical protein
MNTCQLLGGQFGYMLISAIVDPMGIVLNGMCVLCIAQILRQKSEDSKITAVTTTSNMFKFLLVKAVCDMVFFANDVFYTLNFCGSACHLYATPIFTYWLDFFWTWLEQILWMLSPLMEIAATLGIKF